MPAIKAVTVFGGAASGQDPAYRRAGASALDLTISEKWDSLQFRNRILLTRVGRRREIGWLSPFFRILFFRSDYFGAQI